MMRRIIPEEVKFSLDIEGEDIPVRGNAMASDDEDADREYEDEILERLEVGDIWAWARVIVRASWKGFEGNEHIGGCSYRDEADFRKSSGYLDDMVEQAFGNLLDKIRESGWAIECRGEDYVKAHELGKATV